MTKEPPNKIAFFRKMRRMTQQELADEIGAHWITVSKLERGILPLTLEWSGKLSRALKVDESEFRPAVTANIFVSSLVKEGKLIGTEDGEPHTVAFDTAAINPGNTFWAVVADNALYPHFQSGDLLRLVVTVDEPKKYVGRLCLVRPADEPRYYICYLEQGRTPGTFTARLLTSRPLVDIKISTVALIERAIFQPKLTKEIRADIAKVKNI